MKNVYTTVVNMMAFYFLVSLFNGILEINIKAPNEFSRILLPAIFFGLLFSFLPSILKFFKMPENNGSLLLGGIVVNFFYYFLGYYVFKVFLIKSGTIIFGIAALGMKIDDRTFGFLMISLISSALSVILLSLNKK